MNSPGAAAITPCRAPPASSECHKRSLRHSATPACHDMSRAANTGVESAPAAYSAVRPAIPLMSHTPATPAATSRGFARKRPAAAGYAPPRSAFAAEPFIRTGNAGINHPPVPPKASFATPVACRAAAAASRMSRPTRSAALFLPPEKRQRIAHAELRVRPPVRHTWQQQPNAWKCTEK